MVSEDGDRGMKRATGRFDVRLEPLESYNQAPDAEIGRLSIDKTLEGDLVATSQGEMLSGGSPASGSAGYVAIERVTGSLHGRRRQLPAAAFGHHDADLAKRHHHRRPRIRHR